MSHADVAHIWDVLAGRGDVGHVVLELIGNFYLNTSVARRDRGLLRDAYIAHIASIRIILDLQRTYLQCSQQTPSELLPSEVLYSTVLHLLDAIVASTASCPDLSAEFEYNRLTAQTTLSALRMLLLRKQVISTREYDQLNARFEEIFERGHWQGTEFTIIMRLCRQSILTLANAQSNPVLGEPACSAVNFPGFSDGLNRFELLYNAMASTVSGIGRLSLQSERWFIDCLTIYDIYWGIIAALVYSCQQQHRSERSTNSYSGAKTSVTEDLQKVLNARLLTQREAGLDTGSSTDDRTTQRLRLAMVQDLASMCAAESCNCLVPVRQQLQHGQQTVGLAPSGFLACGTAFDTELTQALQLLRQSLDKRSTLLSSLYSKRITLPKIDGLGPLSANQRAGDLVDRIPKATRSETELSRSHINQPARPTAVHSLSNPEIQHEFQRPAAIAPVLSEAAPLTTEAIFRQPSDRSATTTSSAAREAAEVFSDRSGPLSSIGEDPPLTTSQRAESDTDKQTVILGRQTTSIMKDKPLPLVTIESLPEVYNPGPWSPPDTKRRNTDYERSQSWVPDLDNHPELASPSNTSVLRNGVTSPGAPSIMSEDSGSVRPLTVSVKQKKWHKGLFGGTPAYASLATTSPPSYTFSASGTMLLTWNSSGAGFYDTNDIDAINFIRIGSANTHIHLGAAGVKRCVLVVKDTQAQTSRLEVFELPTITPIRTFPLHSPPHALVLSPNDALIAAKYSRCVDIYHIPSGNHIRHALPSLAPRSRVNGRDNHLVCFSQDSNFFAATTRYEPERVITYYSPCFEPDKATSIETANPTGFPGDNGLSALMCSAALPGMASSAFLTSFTEKGGPLFLSLKSSNPQATAAGSKVRPIRDPKGRIGTRVHHAALSPGGKSIALINQRNDVFWIEDCWVGGIGAEPRRVATVKRNVSVVKDMVMGMPSSDEVNLFWMEKGSRGMLVTVGKGGGKSKPIVIDLGRDLAEG